MNLINDKGVKKKKYYGSSLWNLVFKRLDGTMCVLF